MDIEEFRESFLNESAAWAASEQNFRHSSFLDVAVRHLEEADEVADFQAIYYRGIGEHNRALAIDGYSFDDADDSLRVFLVEASLTDDMPTLTQTDAKAHFRRLSGLLEQAVDGRLATVLEVSSPAHGLAVELAARLPGTARIRAYLLTDALLSTRVRDWPEGRIAGVPVEYHIWDMSRFHRAFTSRTGRDDLLIDLSSIDGGGVPCIEAGTDSEEYSAYLCVVPGRFLAELYEEYGSRLLEGNVRSFLAVRGKVNKGIRNTILHDSPMFFAYNNGIAATASSVTVATTSRGAVITSATDLQIVNGGQTTASLASARRNDRASLDHVFVPMKLSVVLPERSGEMIPLIARYANSQNRVSDADFFSNHEFHRRLEEISRRLWVPARGGAQHETHWFYERTRGEYLNEMALLTAARRRSFEQLNPRNQVLTKTDLAKSENAWRQLPHLVSRGAQKNFLEFAAYVSTAWDKDAAAFHEDYWRTVAARTLMFRATEKLVSAQTWYLGGYRANIVAYTIAGLSHVVEEQANGRGIDFLDIWRNQALPHPLKDQLGAIAEAMHEVVTNPLPGVQNVTEWSKKEICWQQACDRLRSVHLTEGLRRHLIDLSVVREVNRTARAQQKQDTGIDAQAQVISLGSSYWQAVEAWSRSNYPVSPEEYRLIHMVSGYGTGLPTDRQSVRLLQVKERLELEGMPPPELLAA